MKLTLKTCSICKEDKEVKDFYLMNGKPEARCKPCRRSYVKERLSDPVRHEKDKAYQRANYESNKKTIQLERKKLRTADMHTKIVSILGNSRGSAKVKGLAYNINVTYVKELYERQDGVCALSGEVLTVAGDRYLSNMISLDRVDSSKGYIMGNVQWVCVKYNMMKAHATQEDFINMCKQVWENSLSN